MFNWYELLELFDKESLLDEEAGIVKYFIEKDGFTFSLYISSYEGTAIITLKYKFFENPIYDIDLQNVISIEVERKELNKSKLNFYGENKKLLLAVLVRPEFSFQTTFNKF